MSSTKKSLAQTSDDSHLVEVRVERLLHRVYGVLIQPVAVSVVDQSVVVDSEHLVQPQPVIHSVHYTLFVGRSLDIGTHVEVIHVPQRNRLHLDKE